MGHDFQEELDVAFRFLDNEETGEISCTRLRTLLTTVGDRMSENEVDAFLKECDINGDGFISVSEFRQMPCWQK